MKKLSFLFVFIVFITSGCINSNINSDKDYKIRVIDNTNDGVINVYSNIEEEFNILLSKDPSEKEVLDYIEKYIYSIDSETNDYLVFGLEKIQKKNITRKVNSFFKGNIQEKFSEEDSLRKSYIEINEYKDLHMIEDNELKEFILDYIEIGYKVIGKNGVFYPEINYDYYLKYQNYLTLETNIYFGLMQNEYNYPAIDDGVLNITWDEVFKRILLSEKYVINYKDSEKINEINSIYNRYIEIYLYGTSDTKAYDDRNKIKKYLKQSYDNVYLENLDSPFVQKLREFFIILDKSNYYLNSEVEQYRTDIKTNLN